MRHAVSKYPEALPNGFRSRAAWRGGGNAPFRGEGHVTIDDIIALAERVHDAEGMNFGASSTRAQRNEQWARIIGIVHHGHPGYNPAPDRRWHIKSAGPGRPQSDDVVVLMPSREYWDCIPGSGTNGYRFHATHDGVLGAEQYVFPPPVPDGNSATTLRAVSTPPPAGPICPDPSAHQPKPAADVPDRGEMIKAGRWLDDFYRAPEGLGREDGLLINGGIDWEGVAVWLFDVYLRARIAGRSPDEGRAAVVEAIRQTPEWREKHRGE